MTEVAKPRILVVEDDPDLRRILKLQLESNNYVVTEAENGAEGFQAIQDDIPDCVILDLMMPEKLSVRGVLTWRVTVNRAGNFT